MHWAREKSTDHMNKVMRHLDDYGRGIKKDTDGCWHLAKAIWRLKARLQLDIEEERALQNQQQDKLAAALAAKAGSNEALEAYRKEMEKAYKPGQVFPHPNKQVPYGDQY
jgi:hypothetical protein